MKVSDLKVQPQSMECCKNDCENFGGLIKKCVQPLCFDLAVANFGTCWECEGTGKIRANYTKNGSYVFHKEICSNCNGTGFKMETPDGEQ